MQITLNVDGMHCQKCVDKVEKFVGEIDGVSFINVDLAKKSVSVEFESPADKEKITEAILESGFEVR